MPAEDKTTPSDLCEQKMFTHHFKLAFYLLQLQSGNLPPF